LAAIDTLTFRFSIKLDFPKVNQRSESLWAKQKSFSRTFWDCWITQLIVELDFLVVVGPAWRAQHVRRPVK